MPGCLLLLVASRSSAYPLYWFYLGSRLPTGLVAGFIHTIAAKVRASRWMR